MYATPLPTMAGGGQRGAVLGLRPAHNTNFCTEIPQSPGNISLLLGFFFLLWTVAHQASLFMGFPRQGYWSGLSFPSPGHLSDPGIKPASPALAGEFITNEPLGKHSISLTLNCLASPALRLRTSITEFSCESRISDPKFVYVSLVLKD